LVNKLGLVSNQNGWERFDNVGFTYGKNLKACGTKAAAVNAFLISSSVTFGLSNQLINFVLFYNEI